MIDDRRQTMHDDGRRPIAKVHLSDSGDLENITGKQSLANACLTPSNLCYTNLSNIFSRVYCSYFKSLLFVLFFMYKKL